MHEARDRYMRQDVCEARDRYMRQETGARGKRQMREGDAYLDSAWPGCWVAVAGPGSAPAAA